MRRTRGSVFFSPVRKLDLLAHSHLSEREHCSTSTGYIAIHHGTLDGHLLGYLHNHKIVPYKSEAVLYTYTTTGYVTEIMVAVSCSRAPLCCWFLNTLLKHTDLRMCVSTGFYGQSLGLGLKK